MSLKRQKLQLVLVNWVTSLCTNLLIPSVELLNCGEAVSLEHTLNCYSLLITLNICRVCLAHKLNFA